MRSLLVLAALAAASAAPACTDRASCSAAIKYLADKMGRLGDAARAVGSRFLAARSEAVWAAVEAANGPLHELGVSSADSTWCPKNAAFELLPVNVANLTTVSGSSVSWSGDGCFDKMSAVVTYTPTGAVVNITGSTGFSICSDTYIVASSYSVAGPAEVSVLATSQLVTLTYGSAEEAADVAMNGLVIGLLPCGLLGSITSAVATVGLFIGSDQELLASNAEFLQYRGVWSGPGGPGVPLQPFNSLTTVDPSVIRSGDYLAILRMDGLDPMISYGTGFGATGHSALAVWQGEGANRTLYVCESTDKNPFGPVYFPPPFGVGRRPWSQWVPEAHNASFHVSVLPLAPQYANAFNETAYWQWFSQVEGLPYGYANFLYSVLDTSDPLASLPLPLVTGLLTPVMNLIDILLGQNETDQVTVWRILTQGLNKRLGTDCTTLACTIAAFNANKAAKNGGPTNLAEAVAIPEQDSWRYNGNASMVCSAFAAAGWQAGLAGSGLLPVFQATEQTPIDNVRTGIFDPARFTAANCPGGLHYPTNGNGTVCQLMGPYVMPLNGYNTVPLYLAMNERCGSQWPTYVRCLDGQQDCQC